ncbi:MAG: class I SAM-dependent methyltransferase [Candidatus Micrarchaeaceae archaeon]
MSTYHEVLDSKASLELNKSFYSAGRELWFITEAMRSDYPKALARKIYGLIGDDYLHGQKVKIADLGARGIYFGSKLYDEISAIDKAHGTDFAERINYILLDLSKAAIEEAKKEYAELRGQCFDMEFITGDVLKAELPKGIDITIMNELLDDLEHVVVTKKGGVLFEVTFKLASSSRNPELATLTLHRKGIKLLEHEDEPYLSEIRGSLGEGKAITFSPVIGRLFRKIASVSSEGATLFIHDYFAYKEIDYKRASTLKRVFGQTGTDVLYADYASEGLLQVTCDVNLEQVLHALSLNGYTVKEVEDHELFLRNALNGSTGKAHGKKSAVNGSLADIVAKKFNEDAFTGLMRS